MSKAAYLMAEHGIDLIEAFLTETGRFRIVLNIGKDEAERLLLEWPTSKMKIFDGCIRDLKDILCCDNPPRKNVGHRRNGGGR